MPTAFTMSSPHAPCACADQPAAKVWAAAMAVAERTPRWRITGADEPRYLEGVATSLVFRFKVRTAKAASQQFISTRAMVNGVLFMVQARGRQTVQCAIQRGHHEKRLVQARTDA